MDNWIRGILDTGACLPKVCVKGVDELMHLMKLGQASIKASLIRRLINGDFVLMHATPQENTLNTFNSRPVRSKLASGLKSTVLGHEFQIIFTCPGNKSQTSSLDFLVDRFYIKISKTNNINIVSAIHSTQDVPVYLIICWHSADLTFCVCL